MTRRSGLITATIISVVGVTVVTARLMANAVMHGSDLHVGIHSDSVHAGPDSARVVSLLAALHTGDPLVCELLSDQIGNFWSSRGDDGVGRFGDARKSIDVAKDSVHGRISGTGTLAVLVEALNATDPCVRRVAAKWLGRSTIDNAQLERLLSDASPRTRESAAYAIGEGDRERRLPTRTALEKLLQSGGGTDGAMAAWALGELEDSASVLALAVATRAPELPLRLAAIDALGKIKDPRSLALLERILRTDAQPAARVHAARAVGEFETASSMTVLAAAISDPAPAVQYAAVEAMDGIGDVEIAPPALVQASRSPDAHLAEVAVLALARIHDPLTIDALLAHIAHPSREVRMRVAEALGEMKLPKASGGLIRLLRDPDADVRKAAVEALGEIEQ